MNQNNIKTEDILDLTAVNNYIQPDDNSDLDDNSNSEALSTEQVEDFVSQFWASFEQSNEPKFERPWTYNHFVNTCDSPKRTEPIQAVLLPDDAKGFALYARQGSIHRPITYKRKRLHFRTIEQALNTLSDVMFLSQEVVIDLSNWRQNHEPV